MRGASKETPTALGAGALVVATMAVDHLLGTEEEPGEESGGVEAGVVVSSVAVPALALLFLGVQLPLAAAGVALGLRAREGERTRLGTAAVAIGALVTALTVAAYGQALA